MNTGRTEIQIPSEGKNIRTCFEIYELEEAFSEILRAKLVEEWEGSLNLETDGESIVLTHYASSNSWQQGYDTIYSIENYHHWSDFLEGIETDEDGNLVDFDGNVKTKGEMFDDIDFIHDSIPAVFEEVQEKLAEVVAGRKKSEVDEK
jgi:hypothetical protein